MRYAVQYFTQDQPMWNNNNKHSFLTIKITQITNQERDNQNQQ